LAKLPFSEAEITTEQIGNGEKMVSRGQRQAPPRELPIADGASRPMPHRH
jgi:hypothetical protein